MRSKRSLHLVGLAVAVVTGALLLSGAFALYGGRGVEAASKWLNPCSGKTDNPCGAKTLNPCAAKTLNPCGAKTLNPCATKTLNPCNPCGAKTVDPSRIRQPAGVTLARGSGGELAAEGEKLWNDRFLGKSGLACSSCHLNQYGQMQETFAKPYPHYVAMPAQQAGLQQVSAAEMVQFCMAVPMMTDPFPWNSRELAALTAYVERIQADVDPTQLAGPSAPANPCNPCSPKNNPCNPCSGGRNPCGEGS
jgi:cytochrome c